MKPARQPGAPTSTRRYSQPIAVGLPGAAAERERRMSEIPSSSSGSNLRASDVTSSSRTPGVDDKGPVERTRRNRAAKDIESPSFDPETYNPDGSIRTVHKMPSFNDSYAEASKARYIRHRSLQDREKELTVNQVFDHS